MSKRDADMALTVFTIGHSTRPIDEFIELLEKYGIREIVDVRTVPRSRHNPQFNKDALPLSLDPRHIAYVHLAELGGLRHTKKDSINTAWRNASFRGFADYMQPAQFEDGLKELLKITAKRPTAIMCAEAVHWRCHRSLIGDALLVRGVNVVDIIGPDSSRTHELTSFAKVDGKHVTYPADDQFLPLEE